MSTQTIQVETLAGEILRSTVTSLLMNMRFLESALFRLQPQPADTTVATDGQKLYYGYDYLFRLYRRDPAELSRGYLHTLLHCIFRHPFVGRQVDRALWDLSADIAVEAAIADMNLPGMQTDRGKALEPLLKKLRDQGLRLTAEKLYHHFSVNRHDAAAALSMADAFRFCDHAPWYAQSTEGEEGEEGRGEENRNDDSGGGRQEQNGSDADADSDGQEPQSSTGGQGGGQHQNAGPDGAGSGQQSRPDAGGTGGTDSGRSDLAAQWEDISRHVQMALETFGQQAGDRAGNMIQELRALNREHYDYRRFLQQFATLREVMKINDEEFDYIFYTYGLELYGNLPLIEPLEYAEARRIRDFAVVVDTSGSTAGDLVQTFLQKTYNILRSTETFDSRIRLRIIQCDAAVQESVMIGSQKEFEEYIRTFRIRGQGGTDFRPAFAHVDELVRSGELSELKGLIYFTDGYGTYPKTKPAYDAAFVFVRENDYDEPPAVPPWAIKLVLDKEEVAAV